MMKEKVEKLVQEALLENESLFLIEFAISAENQIKVLLDGDNGLPLEEIIRVSRHIEHNLDREEQDFSLEVSSVGIGSPLILPRQYRKNIGRNLSVLLDDDSKIEGKLVDANQEEFILNWKQREPKPVGKGKHTVEKTQTVTYKQTKKAVVKISF